MSYKWGAKGYASSRRDRNRESLSKAKGYKTKTLFKLKAYPDNGWCLTALSLGFDVPLHGWLLFGPTYPRKLELLIPFYFFGFGQKEAKKPVVAIPFGVTSDLISFKSWSFQGLVLFGLGQKDQKAKGRDSLWHTGQACFSGKLPQVASLRYSCPPSFRLVLPLGAGPFLATFD